MRIRDIEHQSGRRLRIGLDRGCAEEAMIIQLSNPAQPGSEPVLLDIYGGELLAGFLMNARLAGPTGNLADEVCVGPLACRIRLIRRTARTVVELCQGEKILAIPQIFWDRLYAELMLALVHGRHLDSLHAIGPSLSSAGSRLLH